MIKEVSDVDFEIERLCSKGTSNGGSGGMLSKVRAAKHAINAGIEVMIGNGFKRGIILSSVTKDFPGTRFAARKKSQAGEAKRWMMSAKGVGTMIIDEGAIKALRSGKSLLLPGVISLKGDFERNEIIEIISKYGKAIAYGKINYSADEVRKALIKRKQAKEKKVKILDKEVIHRDYMVIFPHD